MTYTRHKQSAMDRILDVMRDDELTVSEILARALDKYPKKTNTDSMKSRISLAVQTGVLTKGKTWPAKYKLNSQQKLAT